MMDRRDFLMVVSVLTGGLVVGSSLEAEAVGDFDWLSEGHRRDTMRGLFEILLPSAKGRSPGANDAQALELFRGDKFVKTAVQLGQFPALATQLAGVLGTAMEQTLVQALDQHPLTIIGMGWFALPQRKPFKDLSGVRRRLIVAQILRQRKIVPVGPLALEAWRRRVQGETLELARTTALFAYAGGVLTEAGLTGGLGWPRYDDFQRGRHNTGYPVVDDPVSGKQGFSFNRVPAASGPWAQPWGDALGNPW